MAERGSAYNLRLIIAINWETDFCCGTIFGDVPEKCCGSVASKMLASSIPLVNSASIIKSCFENNGIEKYVLPQLQHVILKISTRRLISGDRILFPIDLLNSRPRTVFVASVHRSHNLFCCIDCFEL